MAATYTVKQVANILGYSTNSIYSFLKEKRLKGVRLGKGRFRIPQSELDRLLLISKKQAPSAPQVAQTEPVTSLAVEQAAGVGMTDLIGGGIIDNPRILGRIHVGTLNIFDWFIGAGSVIAGVGLFLFNTSLERAGVSDIAPLVGAMRTVLIGGGIGIVLTNVTGHTDRAWHKLFHVILGVMGLVNSVILWKSGQLDGALIYGFLGILVLLSMVIHLGGIAWVSLYISMLTVSTVISLILAEKVPHLKAIIAAIPVSPVVFIAMVSVGEAVFLLGLWWGYFRSKHLFWLTTWIAAFWYFGIAFWYATDQYWSRSFFFLVVGMTSLFLSPWEELVVIRNRKANLFTMGVFTAIMAVLLVGITAVYLMQLNVISTVKRENVYKAQYAKSQLETAIESVIATIQSAATNRAFVSMVVGGDIASLNEAERVMYESNSAIRRLVVLSSKGQGVNLYPFGTFDTLDLSGRDYFTVARDTGRPFVSDLFTAAADQSRRQVVTVAVPLYGGNDTFSGVLAASLDLEGLSARLQKIGVPDRGEYVVVIDSTGRRILHWDTKLIGAAMNPTDPIFSGLKGKSGVAAGDMIDGTPAVVAYEPIEVRGVHWALAIKSPIGKIYELTDASNLSIFAVIIAAVIVAGFILHGGFYWRKLFKISGGSP